MACCLPNWVSSVGKERACVLSYPLKQPGMQQIDKPEEAGEKNIFPKPIFYLQQQQETGEERYGNETAGTEGAGRRRLISK